MLEGRIRAVCDELCVSKDERLYLFSAKRLALELVKKARKMVESGLPASLEAKFVKQALDVPVMGVRREESGVSIVDEVPTFSREVSGVDMASQDALAGAASESASAATSQESDISSASTTAASVTTTATSTSSTSTHPPDDTLHHLLRLRTALDFLLSSYIPSIHQPTLRHLLTNPTLTALDFTPLNERLASIAKQKAEAVALRTISDNVSRKRGVLDDEDAIERAETKKRKKEEEEAKKKSRSLGVKKLMKADTSGMAKLSSFFSKGAVGKKVG